MPLLLAHSNRTPDSRHVFSVWSDRTNGEGHGTREILMRECCELRGPHRGFITEGGLVFLLEQFTITIEALTVHEMLECFFLNTLNKD